MGYIYRRKKRLSDGTRIDTGPYWIKYYQDGRPIQEPVRSFKKGDAERLLKLREGVVAKGIPVNLRLDKVLIGELLADLLLDYKSKPGKRNHRPVNSYDSFAEPIVRLHLRPAFGHVRAARLSTTLVNRYRDERLEAGAAPATINREMAMLKRALNLGRISTPSKVLAVAHIPMFEEDNTRTGFYEHEEFTALRAAIEEPLRPVVTFAYYTGCRRGEILSLQWPQVQLEDQTVILEPGTTKNKEGRILPLHGEVYEVMAMQKAIRDQKCPDCPWVFFRVKDGLGVRIVEFRDTWEKACKAARLVDDQGEVNRLFHDFRRTGVRNLIRAGVPERVAMKISGHKTRSVFDRYNIIDERDLRDAARRLDDYLATKKQETQERHADGYNPGTVTTEKSDMTGDFDSELLN